MSAHSQVHQELAEIRTEGHAPGTQAGQQTVENAATRIVPRLRDALEAMLEAVPRTGTSTLSLSRDLGVDRNLVQQTIAACQHQGGVTDIIKTLPGTRGLRVLVDRARRRGTSPTLVSKCSACVDEYEKLIVLAGGTRATLARSLGADVPLPQRGRTRVKQDGQGRREEVSEEDRAGRTMFEASRQLLGYEVSTITLQSCMRQLPNQATLIEGAHLSGLIGVEATGRVPMMVKRSSVSYASGDSQPYSQVTSGVDARTALDGMVSELSTQPFPDVVSVAGDGALTEYVDFDADAARHGKRTIDVVLGQRWGPAQSTLTDAVPAWGQTVHVKRPAKNLLIEVYMHKDLAAKCMPSAFAYMSHSSFALSRRAPGEHLPVRPRVELLGRAHQSPPSAVWKRSTLAAEYLMRSNDWDLREYIGYRCEVRYPIWGAMYCLLFDFTVT